MLCASRFVLNINYHQLSINYFINFFSLIFMLSFKLLLLVSLKNVLCRFLHRFG